MYPERSLPVTSVSFLVTFNNRISARFCLILSDGRLDILGTSLGSLGSPRGLFAHSPMPGEPFREVRVAQDRQGRPVQLVLHACMSLAKKAYVKTQHKFLPVYKPPLKVTIIVINHTH